MGLSSSLNAGVQGLAVNSTKLSAISDNISNSETFGYKRVSADFSNMVVEQSNGAYTAGGVTVATFREVDAQGSLISTSNSTDISISGRGMLPVTTVEGVNSTSVPLYLTATGSFTADQDGNLMTTSSLYLLGWPADINGNIIPASRDSAADLEVVNVTNNQFIASPTTEINLGLNVPASATQAGASGDSYDLPIEYFDTLGRSETLTMTFTPQVPGVGASNTWTAEIYDSASATPAVAIATFDVTFDDTAGTGGSILSVVDGAGATYDAATGLVAINVASQSMDLNIGIPGGGGPLTQLSSAFSPISVTKDGAPVGNLSGVEINNEGLIEAVYDNGYSRVIYQIPVADVPNLNGLTALSNQTFAVSSSSGDVYFWDAGAGPVGTTVGYTLAESTTDIAQELTDLIQTQRAYSSNAKIIQTVDEMLQETTNLKR